MKKILAVSLGALLVASAANAETTNTGIASVSYVDGALEGKQNTISDLATIRSGAALGATAVQNLGNLGVTATATELNYVDGVTSSIQTQLNSKQAALGYTAENAANKVTSVSSSSTDTQYPSAKAMYTALAGKQASLGYTAENAANKVTSVSSSSTDTQYPSAKAVKTALDYKVNIKQGTDNAGKGLIVEGTNGTLTLVDIATQEELNAVARTASSGQTATQVNTAITNAIGGLDVASVGEAGKFVITIKQENGLIDAGVKSFVNTLSDGVLDAPTTDAVYDALQGKLSTTGTAAKATADASGNVITTTYATKSELTTGLNGKLGTSLGSTAASKAVITDTSGNITTGTISSAMITDGTIATGDIANSAVTSAKIADGTIAADDIATGAVTSVKILDGTIANADIASNAAIAQSKISGLTTALNSKQDAAPRDESGNSYFVVTPDGVWKDMFDSMQKDEACQRSDVKCALTHKAGQYVWEVVRE